MRTLIVALLALALAACSPAPHGNNSSAPGIPGVAPTTSADAPVSTPATHAPPTAAHQPATPASMATTGPVLTRYHWQLETAIDANGQRLGALFARPDRPLQLDFTARTLAIVNACNRMHATYTTAAGKLTVGAMATTLMACPEPALATLDRAVGEYINGTLAYATDISEASPQLILTTLHGDKLVFNGVPTAATRFGSAGATAFLEVAPETRPCNNPGMPHAQCLYVRELHYDAKGLRAGKPGAWHILGQPIEGYTHAAGVRNVLRVKRYAIAHPPADGSSAAYVLDMVVESGTAPAASH